MPSILAIIVLAWSRSFIFLKSSEIAISLFAILFHWFRVIPSFELSFAWFISLPLFCLCMVLIYAYYMRIQVNNAITMRIIYFRHKKAPEGANGLRLGGRTDAREGNSC